MKVFFQPALKFSFVENIPPSVAQIAAVCQSIPEVGANSVHQGEIDIFLFLTNLAFKGRNGNTLTPVNAVGVAAERIILPGKGADEDGFRGLHNAAPFLQKYFSGHWGDSSGVARQTAQIDIVHGFQIFTG